MERIQSPAGRGVATAAAVVALALGGAWWAGCGGDDNDASEAAQDAVDKATNQAQKQAEEATDKVQNQVDKATDKAQNQVDKATDKAQKQLDKAQEQAGY